MILVRVGVLQMGGETYSERGLLVPISSSHIFFPEQGGVNACTSCKLVRDASDRLRVPLSQLQFSALCPNLTVWFSSHSPLPITHLLYPNALIALSCSYLLIKMRQLAKAHGVTMNEPKIHVICYMV